MLSRRRHWQTLAAWCGAAVALALVYRQAAGVEWAVTARRLRDADARLLLLAFAVFAGTLLVRTLRWRTLLENVGYGGAAGRPLPSTGGLARILFLSWFANCVTVARLGDAYRGYLLKQAAGTPFVVVLGTVLTERLIDLVVLLALLSATALLASGGSAPPEASGVLAGGLLLTGVGLATLVGLGRFWPLVARAVPGRLQPHYARLEEGVVGSFRRLPVLVAYTMAGWGLEGLTVYLVAAAVDVTVSMSGAVVVALAGSLLTTIPVTPAGLGVAEVGMVVLLGRLGLDPDGAAAVTILARVVTYWSIVVLGAVVLALGRRAHGRDARRRADAPPAVSPEAPDEEVKQGEQRAMPRSPSVPHRSRDGAPTVDVVIPVYNEEAALPRCIATLRAYLDAVRPGGWSITIADNASVDRTLAIARELAAADPRIRVLHLDATGRGRALRAAWLASEADVVAYMDVDLSTDLNAFPALLAPLLTGEADLATGSRLLPGAIVTRSLKREILSRGYNRLLKLVFRSRFSDAQCGFKALRREAARALLPWVEDQAWFFDTELLLLAEEAGLRLHEVPVAWVEDPDSRVKLLPTILADLSGIWRVRARRRTGSLAPVRMSPCSDSASRVVGRLPTELVTVASSDRPSVEALRDATRSEDVVALR